MDSASGQARPMNRHGPALPPVLPIPSQLGSLFLPRPPACPACVHVWHRRHPRVASLASPGSLSASAGAAQPQ
eukprot:364953-Chlamydomonas_euryale.AAC.7